MTDQDLDKINQMEAQTSIFALLLVKMVSYMHFDRVESKLTCTISTFISVQLERFECNMPFSKDTCLGFLSQYVIPASMAVSSWTGEGGRGGGGGGLK